MGDASNMKEDIIRKRERYRYRKRPETNLNFAIFIYKVFIFRRNEKRICMSINRAAIS